MPQYVVLLRGVNVGKGNRLPMADFRAMLTELGCSGVQTILNSGNAVVTSAARSEATLSASIARALERDFGISTPVIVRRSTTVRAIAERAPIQPNPDGHSRFLVIFAQTPASLATIGELLAAYAGPDEYAVSTEAAYLDCPNGLLESEAAKLLLGPKGKAVTTRNWATLLRIVAAAKD